MTEVEPMMSPRLQQAFDFAALAHEGQYRKDPVTRIPYFAHCAAVAMLLARYGFTETVIIAGLLHDVIEDQPEQAHALDQFGTDVVALINWVSETKTDDSGQALPWTQRKATYIEQLHRAPTEAKAISCADKIHNMQSIILTRNRGNDPWAYLKGDRKQQLSRFHRLHKALADGWEHALLTHYRSILQDLEEGLES